MPRSRSGSTRVSTLLSVLGEPVTASTSCSRATPSSSMAFRSKPTVSSSSPRRNGTASARACHPHREPGLVRDWSGTAGLEWERRGRNWGNRKRPMSASNQRHLTGKNPGQAPFLVLLEEAEPLRRVRDEEVLRLLVVQQLHPGWPVETTVGALLWPGLDRKWSGTWSEHPDTERDGGGRGGPTKEGGPTKGGGGTARRVGPAGAGAAG